MKRARKTTQGDGWTFLPACAACGQAADRCRCRTAEPAQSHEKPAVRLRLEKRRGKAVTVLAASGMTDGDLQALVNELKGLCASGGTVKGLEGELQGDHRPRLREFLAARGIRARG